MTGVAGQRATQLLADPYDANPTVDHYLNRAAFGSPAAGTYSSLGAFTILNPSSLQIDTGLSRSFRVLEGQSIQFRWEVFNVPNRLNANAPVTALNNGDLRQDSERSRPAHYAVRVEVRVLIAASFFSSA